MKTYHEMLYDGNHQPDYDTAITYAVHIVRKPIVRSRHTTPAASVET